MRRLLDIHIIPSLPDLFGQSKSMILMDYPDKPGNDKE